MLLLLTLKRKITSLKDRSFGHNFTSNQRSCSVGKAVKNLQISLKDTCRLLHQLFRKEFAKNFAKKFQRYNFLQNTPGDRFWILEVQFSSIHAVLSQLSSTLFLENRRSENIFRNFSKAYLLVSILNIIQKQSPRGVL